MEIKILGPGCSKCKELYKTVTEVVKDIGLGAEVKKVEDVKEIIEAGVMLTPGLMVNGKVKVTGKTLNKKEVEKHIRSEM